MTFAETQMNIAFSFTANFQYKHFINTQKNKQVDFLKNKHLFTDFACMVYIIF